MQGAVVSIYNTGALYIGLNDIDGECSEERGAM